MCCIYERLARRVGHVGCVGLIIIAVFIFITLIVTGVYFGVNYQSEGMVQATPLSK